MSHSCQRVPNILYVMKNPNIPYLTFLKFCPTPLPCCLQPSPSLLFLMSCFFEWMGDLSTFNVLLHLMILWIYKCHTLYLRNRQTLICFRGLTNNVFFYWYSDLISHTHTHTYIHTKIHSPVRLIDWHNHINTY